jgi:protein-arginine kinase activator protein McsA
MKCERCRNTEAVVHFTSVAGGAVMQRHLCRECSAAEGHQLSPPRALTDWTLLDTFDNNPA